MVRAFTDLLCTGMQVVFNNVTAQYYSAYAGNTPDQFTRRVEYAIQSQFGGVADRAIQSSNTTIAWTGTNYIPLSASANATGKSSHAHAMRCFPIC